MVVVSGGRVRKKAPLPQTKERGWHPARGGWGLYLDNPWCALRLELRQRDDGAWIGKVFYWLPASMRFVHADSVVLDGDLPLSGVQRELLLFVRERFRRTGVRLTEIFDRLCP